MNAKAAQLGMADTRYVEPTGLSSSNQSSARDLALLVDTAYRDSRPRELSTSPDPMTDEKAWAQLAHTLFNTKEFLYYR